MSVLQNKLKRLLHRKEAQDFIVDKLVHAVLEFKAIPNGVIIMDTPALPGPGPKKIGWCFEQATTSQQNFADALCVCR